MPTNLIRRTKPELVNNDPTCAPLTKGHAMALLMDAKDNAKTRQHRISSLAPRIRVELHKNVLNSMMSTLDIPIVNRGQGRNKVIDLTPYLTSFEMSKSVHSSAMGACTIMIKDSLMFNPLASIAKSSQNTFEPDENKIEWLDELEDNDIVVIQMDSGLGDVNKENLQDSQPTELINFSAFNVETSSDLGSANRSDRYSILAHTSSAPLVFFGFVDEISKSKSATGTGGASVDYTISCSDFSKAFDSFVKFLGVTKVGDRIRQSLEDIIRVQTQFTGAVNVPPELVASGLAYLLLGGRNVDDKKLNDLKEQLKAEKKNPQQNVPSGQTSATPVSEDVEQELDEWEIAEQFNKAMGELATSINADIIKDIRPRLFLLPLSLTEENSIFGINKIGDSNPIVPLFHRLGGVQLIELLQVLTGHASYQYTRRGEDFLADDDIKPAILGGTYGNSPSYIRVVNRTIKSLFAVSDAQFQSISSLILDAMAVVPNEVSFFYDLRDFFNIYTLPVAMPTIYCNSYPRPLQMVAQQEVDAIYEAITTGGDESDRRLCEAYATSHMSFYNTPINFVMESDLINETLSKSGLSRSTMAGISLQGGAGNDAVSMTSVFQGITKDGDKFNRLHSPMFSVEQYELAHGFLPNYEVNDSIVDTSAFASGGKNDSKKNFAHAMFVAERDRVLTRTIELNGVVVSSICLPSARVGERLAIFREDRIVPDFATFSSIYLANSRTTVKRVEGEKPEFAGFGGVVNFRYGDNMERFGFSDPQKMTDVDVDKLMDMANSLVRMSSKASAKEMVDRLDDIQTNAIPQADDLGLHDFHGAIRAWFFAHFDCFVIDEVSHSFDVNPQDGGVESATTLTVSYGALGREYPKIGSELLPTGNQSSLETLKFLKFVRENNLDKLKPREKAEFQPSVDFIRSEEAQSSTKSELKNALIKQRPLA